MLNTSVGKIARKYPEAIAVFETLDIEYACKGGRVLTEACEAAGVDAAMVADAIASVTSSPTVEPTIARLVHEILFEQHANERKVMAHLGEVLRTHQNATPEMPRIRRIIGNLEWLILQHMQHEERDLFPAVEQIEKLPRSSSLASRLCIEYVEHDMIDATLHKLRELRLRAELHGAPHEVIDALEGFERRVYRHMHLENNVLFPKALETENQLKQSAVRS